MIICIQPDRVDNQSYSKKWRKFLTQRGVKVRYVDLFRNDALEQIGNSDGLMWRWSLKYPERLLAPILLDIIECEINIPVYPDYKMRSTWDSKISQFYLFQAKRIKTPKTWIFWNEDDAVKWIEDAKFPLVFKFESGASSRNVYLIRTKEEAKAVIRKMFTKGIFKYQNLNELIISKIQKRCYYRIKNIARDFRDRLFRNDKYENRIKQNMLNKNYVYFQEFIPDTKGTYRVAVIGDRAFAYYRYNTPQGDFRADPSGKRYNVSPEIIPNQLIEKAFKIKEKLGIDCVGMDFLRYKMEFYLLEICWTFPDYKLYKCPGHWNSSMEWIESHMWPEEAQVEDFLQKIRYLKK